MLGSTYVQGSRGGTSLVCIAFCRLINRICKKQRRAACSSCHSGVKWKTIEGNVQPTWKAAYEKITVQTRARPEIRWLDQRLRLGRGARNLNLIGTEYENNTNY